MGVKCFRQDEMGPKSVHDGTVWYIWFYRTYTRPCDDFALQVDADATRSTPFLSRCRARAGVGDIVSPNGARKREPAWRQAPL